MSDEYNFCQLPTSVQESGKSRGNLYTPAGERNRKGSAIVGREESLKAQSTLRLLALKRHKVASAGKSSIASHPLHRHKTHLVLVSTAILVPTYRRESPF